MASSWLRNLFGRKPSTPVVEQPPPPLVITRVVTTPLPVNIRELLKPVYDQPGDYVGNRPLMSHEGEALARTLERMTLREGRVEELVEFLQSINPQMEGGWIEIQQRRYIADAITMVAYPHWITDAFSRLSDHQEDVKREMHFQIFRTFLLRAAIAFVLTGLHSDEEENRAVG